MNFLFRLLLGLLGIVLAACVVCWIVFAAGEYILCLLRHWSGYCLFCDRQAVSDACLSHLNPLNLFP